MIYAIISDIHANKIALSAVLKDAQINGVDKIICLGDVVGYGPEPESTASLIRSFAAVSIAGNHDDAVVGRIDSSEFIDLAADAASRHREALSSDNRKWLETRPYIFKGKGFACTHGDFIQPKAFNYITDCDEAAANFSARSEQLLFAGHTHVPGIFLTGASGKVYALNAADFTLEDGKRYIVNPGSVGYPRVSSGICESTYVIFDDMERTVVFRRLPFAVRSVMQTGRNPRRVKKRLIAAVACASALATGTAAWLLAPDERVETVTEVVTNRITRVVEKKVTEVVAIARIDRTESCQIKAGSRKIKLEVKLARGSVPVQLQLRLTDGAGKQLWEERWTVKKSRKASVKIPEGATTAILSAGGDNGSKAAEFDVFNLRAE